MDVQLLLCFDDCPKIIIFFMKLDVHILRGCGLKSYDSGVPGSFVILDVWRGAGEVMRRADLNLFLSCRMGD